MHGYLHTKLELSYSLRFISQLLKEDVILSIVHSIVYSSTHCQSVIVLSQLEDACCYSCLLSIVTLLTVVKQTG